MEGFEGKRTAAHAAAEGTPEKTGEEETLAGRTARSRLKKAETGVFLFVLYSFIGWIYEVVLALIYGWGFVNRGFLTGPYLPIYGTGALILIGLLTPVQKKKIRLGKIPVTPLIVFLLIVLITSVIEYIAGFATERILHTRLWDYSEDWMNLHGYICPRTSFRFGLGGMVFLYLLQPLFMRMIRALPERPAHGAAAVLTGILLLDLTVKIISLIS